MAICKYCKRYADVADWPMMFRDIAAQNPDLCFHCYEETPERADPGYTPPDESDSTESEPTEEVEDEDAEVDEIDATDTDIGDDE